MHIANLDLKNIMYNFQVFLIVLYLVRERTKEEKRLKTNPDSSLPNMYLYKRPRGLKKVRPRDPYDLLRTFSIALPLHPRLNTLFATKSHLSISSHPLQHSD
jgi:hypothetical protein